MRIETIAIHGGYEGDPTTKAVAVPIYQTVRTPSIAPTMVRLVQSRDRRISVTAVSAIRPPAYWSGASRRWREVWKHLCVSTGQAALNYAVQMSPNSAATSFGSPTLRNHLYAVQPTFYRVRDHGPFRGVGSVPTP